VQHAVTSCQFGAARWHGKMARPDDVAAAPENEAAEPGPNLLSDPDPGP